MPFVRIVIGRMAATRCALIHPFTTSVATSGFHVAASERPQIHLGRWGSVIISEPSRFGDSVDKTTVLQRCKSDARTMTVGALNAPRSPILHQRHLAPVSPPAVDVPG